MLFLNIVFIIAILLLTIILLKKMVYLKKILKENEVEKNSTLQEKDLEEEEEVKDSNIKIKKDVGAFYGAFQERAVKEIDLNDNDDDIHYFRGEK